jgi:hypothetical protein
MKIKNVNDIIDLQKKIFGTVTFWYLCENYNIEELLKNLMQDFEDFDEKQYKKEVKQK